MVDTATLRFMRFFLGAYKRRSATMILLLILSGIAEGVGIVTLLPVLELAVNGSAGDSNLSRLVLNLLHSVGLEPHLSILLGLIVVGISAKALLLWLAMSNVGYTVAHVMTDLRLRILRSLLNARWSYFTDQPQGRFAVAIGAEAQRSASAFRESCTVIAHIVQVLIYFVISFLISWQATVFAITAGAIFLAALQRFVRSSRTAGREQTEHIKSLTTQLMDLLSGIKPLKAMALEDRVLPVLEDMTQGLNAAQRHQVRATEGLRLFQEPLIALFMALGLFAALTLAPGAFASMLLMILVSYRLMRLINTIQTRYLAVANGQSAFFSLFELLKQTEGAKESSPGLEAPPRLSREIVFDKVSFGFDETSVLDGVSLTIPAGRFVAIVGSSGAGKTTVADLLLGLYQPSGGDIYVDGVSLTSFDLRAWRSQIGYVPQDTLLFHDSIFHNVALGDKQLTDQDVEDALRLAGAWQFIAGRLEGVHAQVGERGAKLSGGERQRIALARALVRRPSLLILDEPTTALDADMELGICKTLRELGSTVTVVAISHQPAIRRIADLVYCVDEGTVRLLPSDMPVEQVPSERLAAGQPDN